MRQRVISIDGVIYSWCSGHKEYHPQTMFGSNKHIANGIDYRCRVWEREDRINRKQRRATMTPIAAHHSDFDVVNATELLGLMGYDLAKPIHEQFLERNKHWL